MGNICTETRKEEDPTQQSSQIINRNTTICKFQINNMCQIKLILGTYRSHKADLLLVFAQQEFIEYCSEIKDYAQNYLEVLQLTINQHKKKMLFVNINKNCPFKKLVIAVLPPYYSLQSQAYLQSCAQIISQIILDCSDFAFQLNMTPENGNGIPNQTLISLFIKYLSENPKAIKISLISQQLRLLNMARYEMCKLGQYLPLTYKSKEQ